MAIDGGSFSSKDLVNRISPIDGLSMSSTFFGSSGIFGTATWDFSLTTSSYVGTGNFISYNYVNADGSVSIYSGYTPDYYQITPKFTSDAPTGLAAYQLVSYYPYLNSAIYDKYSGIFYVLNSGIAKFGVSGLNGANRIVVKNPVHITTTNNISYFPTPFNPADHYLIVYNNLNADSISLKDYYLAKRPELASSNVLAVSLPQDNYPPILLGSHDQISTGSYVNNLLNPIVNYITGTKPTIRYVCMIYDLPSMFSGSDITEDDGLVYDSVTSHLRHSLQKYNTQRNINYSIAPPAFLNSDYGLVGYERFSACKYGGVLFSLISNYYPRAVSGYIDRVAEGKIKNTYFRGGTGNNNTYLVMQTYESGVPVGNSSVPLIIAAYTSGRITGLPTNLDFRTGVSSANNILFTGGNLAGFYWNGVHTITGNDLNLIDLDYQNLIKFTGYNWYIMGSAESFNGNNYNGGQGTIFKWMLSGSFFGTGHENTPLGACGHSTEPRDARQGANYFDVWESGYCWIEVANMTMITADNLITVVGDPLVVK